MSTLGERIRTLRKQKKLTLEALAGKELTKGMLSLIENNKANPSMESLTYIAKQLGVEVVELLEEISTQELREILEQVEKLYYKEDGDFSENCKQLITLVTPYAERLSYGYEAARILDLYSRSLYNEKETEWRDYSTHAEKMYDEMNLIEKLANIGIFRSIVKFIEHDYVQALEILLLERKKLEEKHAFLPAVTRLDFDYNEAVMQFAVGNTDCALEVMQRAFDFSKKEGIFYRTDALYRLAIGHGMMCRDKQKAEFYVKKLLQFGEFAEDIEARFFCEFSSAHFFNIEQSYSEALHVIDQNLAIMSKENIHIPFYYVEKGKALYGLELYEEALEWLEKATIPPHIHHPYDLSFIFAKEAHQALCYVKLGNKEEALRLAMLSMENINSLPHTPIQDFIYETYNHIKKIAQS